MNRLKSQFPNAGLILEQIHATSQRKTFVQHCIFEVTRINSSITFFLVPLLEHEKSFNSLKEVCELWRDTFDENYFNIDDDTDPIKLHYFSLARIMSALDFYFREEFEESLYECLVSIDQDNANLFQLEMTKWDVGPRKV